MCHMSTNYDHEWSMEGMGKVIKEEYICPLPGFARPKSPLVGESNYCVGGCLRIESNRSNPRLHPSHWIPRRFTPFADRDLVSHSNDSRSGMGRMQAIGTASSYRTTEKLASWGCHNIHLGFVDRCFPILGLALSQQQGKHITQRSTRPKIALRFSSGELSR